jgi:hypothetical protein
MNFGTNHCGLRIESATRPATRADSTATSQAELPPPITSTFLPRHDSSMPLKSCECKKRPSNVPGYSGYFGFQWWPFATISTSNVSTCAAPRASSHATDHAPVPASRVTCVTACRNRMRSSTPK